MDDIETLVRRYDLIEAQCQRDRLYRNFHLLPDQLEALAEIAKQINLSIKQANDGGKS